MRNAWLDFLERLKSGVKRIQLFLVQVILHRILAPLVLFLVYFVAIGLVSLPLRLAGRRLSPWVAARKGSYWSLASGYEPDAIKCQRQS